ncbi:MAG: acetylglutamate kinase [Bacteriovoracaceae bacterium]|nr:acetylglutamate kinase [Bacteriovoracaceae bacterium]
MSCIVIKFGGEVTQSPEQIANLADSVKKLHDHGENIILVHGGGPIASELSKKMGIEPNMVGGRRVTCEKTLEIMKMVLPGIVNSNVLNILNERGLPAAAVSGIGLVKAHKRPPKVVSGSNGEKVDFGHVGDVDDIDPTLLNHLLEKRFIPVINPLSSDGNGMMLNINADTIATWVARKVNAKKVVLVTAIGGVFKDISDLSSRYACINMAQAKELISEGIIQGGMIPKIEEGFKLLEAGMESFHIANTANPETLLKEIEKPGSVGTAIIQ